MNPRPKMCPVCVGEDASHARSYPTVYKLCSDCDRATRVEVMPERMRSRGVPARMCGFRLDGASKARSRPSRLQSGVFVITPGRAKVVKALEGKPQGGAVIVSGPVGSGKSLTIAAFLHTVCIDHPSTRFLWVSESEYLDLGRKSFHDEDVARRFAELKTTPVLVLDDMGAARMTEDWGASTKESLICHRYDSMLSMLITTNLSWERIQERYGERVASRLWEMSGGPVQLTGADWRKTRHATTGGGEEVRG